MNAETTIRPSLIGELAKALAAIEGAQKNATNPHHNKSYADLGAVIAALGPIKEFGLWFRQQIKPDPDGARIETFYIHENGDEMSAGETFIPAGKRDPQGFGSALTYCRRYALQTAFGIAPEDDDGEAAMRGSNRRGQQQARNDDRPRERTNQRQNTRQAEGMPDHALAKLQTLVQATQTNLTAMLEHYRVKSLNLLSEQQYADAVERLEADLARISREQSNQRGDFDPSDIDNSRL